MDPYLPEQNPDGSMTSLVEAPDGVGYRVLVRPVPEANTIQIRRRGLTGLLLRALNADAAASLPEGHQRFMSLVEPAEGGLPVGAKMLSAAGVHDALLECVTMLTREGLEKFDEVNAHYGSAMPGSNPASSE